jgi:hypothetical protein
MVPAMVHFGVTVEQYWHANLASGAAGLLTLVIASWIFKGAAESK